MCVLECADHSIIIFIFFSFSLFLSLLHDEAPPVGGMCLVVGSSWQETVCEGRREG